MISRKGVLGIIVLVLLLAACLPKNEPGAVGEEGQEPEYDIITLLPKDAIPSIDNPRFYSIQEADA